MILHARYRLHGDTSAPVREQDINASTYDEALQQARDDAPDGHDLLSVTTLEA